MTVGISAAEANAFLNRYRNVAAAAIATVYIQVHTADPGSAGTTGISVGSTVRLLVAFNAASGGSMTLSSIATWTNGGTSETLTHISFWDASSGGTFLRSATLSSSQAWVSTNTYQLTTLTVSFPIAA